MAFPQYTTAAEAVKYIKSGDKVFIQGSAATPQRLMMALAGRAHELRDVELISISTYGTNPLADPKVNGSFFINSLFVSENIRQAVNGDQGDYIPVFLSEIHLLFDKKILTPDIALIHVSPPDRHGFCSLGTSVDVTRSAVRHSKHVIAQVNPRMPRTHGDGLIHIRELNALVQVDDELPELNYSDKCDRTDMEVGRKCAELIENGSTLQMGIGCIPDSVLKALTGHSNLGIHTEMLSDGIIPLVESGVITNKFKKKHRGKIITSFASGTRKLYDFIDDNPLFEFLEAGYVNDPHIIRQNPRVVALNSAIEIDLTGQVCSDSIGTYQYSGVGGQMDFIRGASLSEGGKPIIAINSATTKGESKIVPHLKQGAGIVTTRANVHYVVTEFGVANLYGKNLKTRALELLRIAHPDHRETLEKSIFERFGRSSYPAGKV